MTPINLHDRVTVDGRDQMGAIFLPSRVKGSVYGVCREPWINVRLDRGGVYTFDRAQIRKLVIESVPAPAFKRWVSRFFRMREPESRLIEREIP